MTVTVAAQKHELGAAVMVAIVVGLADSDAFAAEAAPVAVVVAVVVVDT